MITFFSSISGRITRCIRAETIGKGVRIDKELIYSFMERMSRRYEQPTTRNLEEEKSKEILEVVEQLHELIAEFLEKGTEWSPQKRKQKKRIIQELKQRLAKLLSVSHLTDEHLAKLFGGLYAKRDIKLFEPNEYPSFEDFEKRYHAIVQQEHSVRDEALDYDPTLDELIQNAWVEGGWGVVEGRMQKHIVKYLFDLGKLMSKKDMYEVLFNDDEQEEERISCREDYRIEQGRHRTLALMILGPSYVQKYQMNKYIKPLLEQNP